MEGSAPTTRAKFHCTSVETTEYGSIKVNLSAVYPNKELDGYEHGEDHAFFKATPYGTLMMQIDNPYGAELFQPGDDFYLDFTKAPKPEPAAAS